MILTFSSTFTQTLIYHQSPDLPGDFVRGRKIPIILLFLFLTAATLASGQDEYQEFYFFDKGAQEIATEPVEFSIYGMEPAYLVINGQNQPYNPSYVQYNSFWIQGSSRWTQYMQCPINARFRLLAFTQGGPATVVEIYPDGYQAADSYQFHPGYTRLIFWADAVGRHTLSYYANGQQSNSIIVDVLPGYTDPYPVPVRGVSADPYEPGEILIDSQQAGFDPNAGPILVDNQEQGFMSDAAQGEPI